MNITITTRGYKAPDRLKQYVTDKINRKGRFYEDVFDVDVILSYEKLTQIAEVKLKTTNKFIIAKEKSEDIFKSIDLVIDNVDRQIKRHKEKQREHKNSKITDNLVVN
ncbi:MAG: ribosome-associated translation inhibitor RaiA [Calditrichia bacterium]|nr:ribosome-associated translation inhibitor RaiA [Calditrichia bacterium]